MDSWTRPDTGVGQAACALIVTTFRGAQISVRVSTESFINSAGIKDLITII